MVLTVSDIRKYLSLNNVDDKDWSDDDLELLLNNKFEELQGLLGFDIVETSHKQYNRNYRGDTLILDYLNVLEIYEIQIDGGILGEDEYVLDENLGIIYFNKPQHGFIIIKYTCGLKDQEYNTLIKPLLLDMITYSVDNNPNKDATSIKEGDISITYDSTLVLGARINNRIKELRNQFSTKIRLL